MNRGPRLAALYRRLAATYDELADELEGDDGHRDIKPEKPRHKRRRVYPPRPATPEQVDDVSRARARAFLADRGR